MRLHFPRLSLISSTLLLLFMLTAGTAGASSSSFHASTNRVQLKTGVLNTASTGTHYLYVDDGTSPDSIDVYKIGTTLTHVGNYPTGGGIYQHITYYGATNIAVTTHCLIYGDENNFIDSYPLKSNGALGTQVSHLSVQGTPSDIHIVTSTNTVYVSLPYANEFVSYKLGTGCTLTTETELPIGHHAFLNFGIAGHVLFAPDVTNGLLVTYILGKFGTINPLNSITSPIGAPDGVAIQQLKSGTYQVYTGQASNGYPQTQAGNLNTSKGTITFLKGSPASDFKGYGGASITIDTTHNILIQGEQIGNTLANYSVANGTLSFKSETPVAKTGEAPSDFAQLNSTLYIDMFYNGDVEACTLKSTGAYGCHTVATLTSTNGYQAGIAIL